MVLEGKKRLLAAWVIFGAVYCWGLGRVGLVGPDEPRYAAIGQAMAASGDWVTPRLWGHSWFEKPALLYWMAGAGYRLGLGEETAARLPVTLLSVVFLAIWFLLLEQEFGRRAAAVSVLLLATCTGWIAYSELCLTDLPMTVFFSLALMLALRWDRTQENWEIAAAGAAAGLAVVGKGLVPVVLLVPCATILWGRWRGALIALIAFLTAAAPWYVACWIQNGTPFLYEFFWRHHFDRFTTDRLQHQQPFWFYVPVLLAALFPWPALLGLIRPDWTDRRQRLLFATAVTGFLFFSVAKNKLPGYLLPLIPALCILIALRASERLPGWAAAATLGLLGCLPFLVRALPGALERGVTHVQPDWIWLMAVIPAMLAWFLLARKPLAALAAGGLTMALGLVLFKAFLLPDLDMRLSARTAWTPGWLADKQCTDGGSRAWKYSLFFYAGAELTECREGAKGPGTVRNKENAGESGRN